MIINASATALLPFATAFLQGALHSVVDARRRLRLHAGEDVGIQVERDPDLGMTKALARDLRMHARR